MLCLCSLRNNIEKTLCLHTAQAPTHLHEGFGNEPRSVLLAFMCVLKSTQGTQAWFLPARCCVKIPWRIFPRPPQKNTIHIHLFTDKKYSLCFLSYVMNLLGRSADFWLLFSTLFLAPQKLTGALVFAFAFNCRISPGSKVMLKGKASI